MKVGHYGLQRSGTNYLHSLISQLHVESPRMEGPRNSVHNKHVRLYADSLVPHPDYLAAPTFYKVEDFLDVAGVDRAVVIVKHPLAWLDSYRRWAAQCGWDDPDHHYLEEWNLYYGRWLSWSSGRIKLVRYVDLLIDPARAVNMFAQWLGVDPPSKVTVPRKVSQSVRFGRRRRRAYLSGNWLRGLDDPSADWRLVDRGTAAAFGFRFERP